MSKIKEIIVEPAKIDVGSIFKIKVKAIRYAIYEEIKAKKTSELKKYTVSELKGE